MDPKRTLEAIRAHWGVEAMHWILDMDFDEDRSRARREDLAENLAMLRHVVINVLRHGDSPQFGRGQTPVLNAVGGQSNW